MADGIMVPCAIGPLDLGKRDGQQFLKGSKVREGVGEGVGRG